MSDKEKKRNRYARITKQLADLLKRTDNRLARMASISAVLHHKMDGFFWTGFYFLQGNRLVAGPYQGPVACQELEYGKGVCWAAVLQKKTVVVEDIDKFPGHIACDARSKSEIVVPVRDPAGEIIAVLDIDSKGLANFDDTDAAELEKIVELINM
ncbi:MAG: GAF domain-containing protein [Bacteroidales bacterium]